MLVLAAAVAAVAIGYLYQRLSRLTPTTLQGVEVATRCTGKLIAALADALTLAADLARTLAHQAIDSPPASGRLRPPIADDLDGDDLGGDHFGGGEDFGGGEGFSGC